MLCTEKENVLFPQSKEGKSPLHMAAIHGRFTRSQILIQNGMDSGDFVLSSPPPESSSLETPFPSLFHLPPYLIIRIGTRGNGPALPALSPKAYEQDNACRRESQVPGM